MMKSEWEKVRLTEFVWFQRGFDLPKNNFMPGNIPVYGSTSILGYHNQSKVNGPGVITGRSGTIGKFQYCTGEFWPHNTSLWVKDFKGNSPKFAFYLLQCLDFKSMNSGGAVPTLNRNLLSSFIVDVPSVKTQKKIASILSAYDDLIENNLKRIKLLEEKAQLTYEEWFVRMKYPGHENDVVDSETGLPEGWVKGVLSDIIGFQNGFAYKSSRFEKSGFPVVKIKNIEDNSISISNVNFINSTYADETKKFKLSSRDLLIAMTGATVGKVGIVPILKTPAYLNQRVGRFLVKEKNNNNIFFVKSFFTVGDGLKYVTNIARGAAQPNISSSQILSIPLNIPSLELLKKYSTMSEIIYKNILFLRSQNLNLKMARSILLPRLMSGMIDIDEIKYNYPKETLA